MLPDNSLKKQECCAHDVTHYRKQGASMLLTIPKSLREFLNWQEGDLLLVTVHRNTLVVLPARVTLTEAVQQYVKETERIN